MSNHLSYIIIFLLFTLNLFSQEQLSEEDLKKKANQLFEEEYYQEALTLYTQLSSNFQNDPEYLYKIGACKLFVESNKENALFFIQIAQKKGGKFPDLYYYLAKAYHLNYRFAEAIKYYTQYQTTGRKRGKVPVAREIEMCKNGQLLLKQVSDVIVTEKKLLDQQDFYKAFDLSGLKGKVVLAPEEFLSKKDKEMGHKPIVFSVPGSQTLYFSSYGEDGQNGKDIYVISKNAEGLFVNPVKIGAPINSPFDEDYPFLHPNGKILYFASKGHNSMGGYDIFRSVYNETNQSWGIPENIDFAISSVGDDFMYITDSLEENAVFASSREAAYGKTHVYRIKTSRVPIQTVVLEGRFTSTLSEKAKITVKNTATEEIIAEYQTDTAGNYAMALPSGQQYTFLIEPDSSQNIHSGVISIPKQTNLVSFNQNIQLENVGGEESLKITNDFEHAKSINNEDMTALLLKNSAQLNVNTNRLPEAVKIAPKSTEPAPALSMLEEENIRWAISEADEKLNQALLLKNKAEQIKSDSSQKETYLKLMDKAIDLEQESAGLKASAESISKNPQQSQNELSKLESDRKNNSIPTDPFSNLYEADLNANQAQLNNLTNDLESLTIEKGNIQDDIKALDQKITDASKKDKPALESQKSAFIEEARENQLQIQETEQKIEKTKQERSILESKNNTANAKLNPNYVAPSAEKEAMKAYQYDSAYNKTLSERLKQIDSSNASEQDKTYQKIDLYELWVSKINEDVLNKQSLTKSLKDNSLEKEQVMIEQQQLEILKTQKSDSLNKYKKYAANYTPASVVSNNSSKIKAEDVLAKEVEYAEKENTLISELKDLDPSISSSFTSYTIQEQSTSEIQSPKDRINYLNDLNEREITLLDEKINTLQAVVDDTNSIESTLLSNTLRLEKMKELKEAKERKKVEYGAFLSQEDKPSYIATDATLVVKTPELSLIPDSIPVKDTTSTPTEPTPQLVNPESDLTFENPNLKQDLELLNQKNDSVNAKIGLVQEKLNNINQQLEKAKRKKKEALLIDKDKTERELASLEAEQAVYSTTAQILEKNNKNNYALAIDQESGLDQYQTKIKDTEDEIQDLSDRIESNSLKLNAIHDKKQKEDMEKQITELQISLDKKNKELKMLKEWEENITNTQYHFYGNALINKDILADSAALTQHILSQEEQDSLSKNQNYQDYRKNEEEYRALNHEIQVIEKQSLTNQDQIQKDQDMALKLTLSAEEPGILPAEKEKRLKEAEVLTIHAQKLAFENDSLQHVYHLKQAQMKGKILKNATILSTVPKALRQGIMATPLRTDTIVVQAPLVSVIDSTLHDSTSKDSVKISEVTEVETAKEEFIILKNASSSAYNNSNPIPIDVEVPSGVIYKVQVGAFKKPIPQDLFKGFAPIVGEKTNSGLTRYLVGNFKVFNNADDAKAKIRELGYKDAFVVGYKDGIRTTLSALNGVSASSTINPQTNSTSDSISLPTNTFIPVSVNKTWDTIQGTYYTIQVGAYKGSPNANLFKNIQPVYTEKLPNGITRYTTGMYTNYEQAVMNKELMKEIGIKDAFVTSYKNGKRITLNDSLQILKDKNIPVNSPEKKPIENKTPMADAKYSVQIGAFKEELALDQINYFVGISRQYPILVSKDKKGMYVYLVGNYNSFQEADNTRKAIRVMYPVNGFVVKTKNGTKIDE